MAGCNGDGNDRLHSNNLAGSHMSHPEYTAYLWACVDNGQHAACHRNGRSLSAGPGWQYLDQYEIKTDKNWILIKRRGTLILSLVFLRRIKQTAPSDNIQVI